LMPARAASPWSPPSTRQRVRIASVNMMSPKNLPLGVVACRDARE
jgi:hypothetical protein